MKALSDLLIEKEELERLLKSTQKKLDKVNRLIAEASPSQQEELAAIEIIKGILADGALIYGDLHHRAHANGIPGSYLRRLLNKYKGRYWDNKRVGNKWFWGVYGSNI